MIEDFYAEVMGIRTHYVRTGPPDAPDVLLVHGVFSSIADWGPTIGPLSERFRVWALDLPGCGLTDKPSDFDQSLASQTDFLRMFLDIVGLDRFHLVGHSMGGRLCIELTRAVRSRVATLTLVSPAVVGLDTLVQFRLATLPGLGEIMTYPTAFGTRMLMKEAVYDNNHITDDVVQDRLATSQLPGAQAAFLRTLRQLAGPTGFRAELVRDLHDWLPELDIPLFVAWGKQDKLTPFSHLKHLEDLTVIERELRLDACGHIPQLEHPEVFNDALLSFLGEHHVSRARG